MNRVKIGVMGAGVFGAFHAGKYANHEKAALTSVFDISPSCAQALAFKHGARAFTGIDSFLEGLDAVVVATPATCHFELAQKALHAGCHVFVEKPLALENAQADELVWDAHRLGRILQVGHQERYVFDAVGLLGRDRAPLKIDCVRCGPPSGRCEDVSVVFDLMIHDIDLIRKLTKSDIVNLSANGDAREVCADIMLENNTAVSLKASRCAQKSERRMTLVYDDGIIALDFVNRTLENSTPAILHSAFHSENLPRALEDPLGYGADTFLNCVLGKSSPEVCGNDGRDAVVWAVKIEDAAGICSSQTAQHERLRA